MLPFVTGPEPEVRTVSAVVRGETVSIDLPSYGALLGGEHLHIAPHSYNDLVTLQAMLLADALLAEGFAPEQAEASGTRLAAVQIGIPTALTEDERRAAIKHATLVAEVRSTLSEAYDAQQTRKATAMIRFRVPGQGAWSDSDTTSKLPRPLIAALAQFADEEADTGMPKRDPEEILSDMMETLGKLGPQAASPPEASTGETSTGAASSSGPETPPTPASGSRGSRSRSSSRRSSGAKSAG